MIIVWLIAVVLAVCFLVVAFGSGLLRFFATAFVVVSTPVREIARLYKSNHKKEGIHFSGLYGLCLDHCTFHYLAALNYCSMSLVVS